MGLSHSPKIVTDGLVFAYDMANTQKSWKGKPTTNLAFTNGATGSQYLAGYSIWTNSGTWSFNDNDTSITKPYLTNEATLPKDLRIISGETTAVGSQHVGFAVTTMSPSTTYTISCWFMQNRAGCSGPYFRTNVNNNSLGSFTYNEDANSANWPVKQWIRITATATTQSNENGGYLSNYIGNAVGDKVWYYGYQVEQNSYATPLVAGTRSNTQALVDLTGQNTITASSLTYASDGTFSFNGSSSDIRTPLFSNARTNVTMNGWFYVNLGTVGTFLSNGDDPGGYCIGIGTYFGTADNQVCGLFGYVRWLLSGVYYQYSGWHMITMTLDDVGTPSIYINGNLIGSYPGSMANVPSAGTGFSVGSQWGIRYANTKSGNVGFYNRALSAAEVKQNFNALRGRYGI